MTVKKPLDSLISCNGDAQSPLRRKLLSLANSAVENILAIKEIKEIYDQIPITESPYEFLTQVSHPPIWTK